jgi:hypothetical protein
MACRSVAPAQSIAVEAPRFLTFHAARQHALLTLRASYRRAEVSRPILSLQGILGRLRNDRSLWILLAVRSPSAQSARRLERGEKGVWVLGGCRGPVQRHGRRFADESGDPNLRKENDRSQVLRHSCFQLIKFCFVEDAAFHALKQVI